MGVENINIKTTPTKAVKTPKRAAARKCLELIKSDANFKWVGLASFELSIEQELRCIYIVNTCDYCLETLSKFHSQISDTIIKEYENPLKAVYITSILYRTEGIY